jgi:hypothetical protein
VIIQDLRQPPIGTVIDPDEVYGLAYTGKAAALSNASCSSYRTSVKLYIRLVLLAKFDVA